MATKTPPVPTTRVKVSPGRTVYVGGGTHPFRPGDELDLPQAEAAKLIGEGHVFDPTKPQTTSGVAGVVSTPIVITAHAAAQAAEPTLLEAEPAKAETPAA
jgi:hypothetical protein